MGKRPSVSDAREEEPLLRAFIGPKASRRYYFAAMVIVALVATSFIFAGLATLSPSGIFCGLVIALAGVFFHYISLPQIDGYDHRVYADRIEMMNSEKVTVIPFSQVSRIINSEGGPDLVLVDGRRIPFPYFPYHDLTAVMKGIPHS
ncbi:MAG: hypothetical protein JSS72_12675 [Armatimonadetes bacterium]|nr:hypothetical protein [Armatimonadota bacterium]